jgi:Phosphotransferase system mannitol/fructose-specific IIA domain (Ntr-type)
MRIAAFFCPVCTIMDMTATDKDQVLQELAEVAERANLDKNVVHAALSARERMGTTAVGNGYAIPHGKVHGLENILVTFARSIKGVDFSAPDNAPCHFFFTVIAPENAVGQHLGLLGSIARLAKDATVTQRLMQAKSAEEIQAFLAGA